MLKGTNWLAALIVVLCAAPALGQSTNTIDIPYVEPANAPVVDGDREDVYDASPVMEMLTDRSQRPIEDELDLSGQGWALWDDNNLYVLFSINDDFIVNEGDATSGTHNDDAVELYIDGDNAKCDGCYDDNDAQLRFRVGDDPFWGGDGFFEGSTDVRTRFGDGLEWITKPFDDDSGYNIEVKVPLANFGISPVDGYLIGLDVHVNDDDDLGDRDSKLHWGDAPGDNQWQWASNFATATLVGGPAAAEAFARITRVPAGAVFQGTEITFDGSTSTAPGSISTYAWDFGDNTSGNGATVTHTYDTPGTYVVTLTVTDDGGVSGTTTTSVQVNSTLGTEDDPLELPRASGVPELDGVRESLWDQAQVVDLEKVNNGAPPDNEADFSTTAWVMWDADALYVFYEVMDEALFNDSADGWRDDRPEVYVDLGHELLFEDQDDNDAYWEFEWNNNVITGRNSDQTPGSEYVSVDTDAGYNIEAKVTWGELGFPIEEGQLIGFELMNNDSDAAGDERQTKMSWFSNIDETWQWSHTLGTAKLVGQLTTAAEDPSELPGGFSIESIYPNPFNPSTTALLTIDQPGEYSVKVFNVLGQAIHEQTLAVQSVGQVSVPFDLRDQASGMYLFTVENRTTGHVVTSKAMLLK